jgi:murein L,D-transpeptidase YcbB/YkuD
MVCARRAVSSDRPIRRLHDIEERLAQLRLNLGRIRELMTARNEDRYILVNIPAFQLEAVERFEVQQRHRVIVGRTERPSPSVNATVKALNFFPYWRVPESVAHLDLVPRLRQEPDYLETEKIRVLNGIDGPEVDPGSVNWGSPEAMKLKFRQDPGPQNALGLVRIDMPNADNVYMHDTPMKTLFDQRSRAFSAGCVRVQAVFDSSTGSLATSLAGSSRAGPRRSSRRGRSLTST